MWVRAKNLKENRNHECAKPEIVQAWWVDPNFYTEYKS